MTDLDTRLGTALRERVADVHPDLDHLVAASVRAGTRIRTRRRVGVSLAVAAGVAAIAVGGAEIAGGTTSGSREQGVGYADEPTASPTPTPAPSTPTPPPSAPVAPATRAEIAPFAVTAPGWTCAVPADEKLDCTKGTDSVHLVWRLARFHADYAGGSPDKTADWVSDVHEGLFVTVDGPGARVVGESLDWDVATGGLLSH